jgi:hypothetical protein
MAMMNKLSKEDDRSNWTTGLFIMTLSLAGIAYWLYLSNKEKESAIKKMLFELEKIKETNQRINAVINHLKQDLDAKELTIKTLVSDKNALSNMLEKYSISEKNGGD